jgi:hypothetical protein
MQYVHGFARSPTDLQVPVIPYGRALRVLGHALKTVS